MADAGVLRAGERLPWLEPYRAPPRKSSNRKAGLAAVAGLASLAGIATVLVMGIDLRREPAAAPSVGTMLPAPVEAPAEVAAPPVVEAPLTATAPAASPYRPSFTQAAKPHRGWRPVARRRIKAEPTRDAYSDVMRNQSDEQLAADTQISPEAVAIAMLPAPPADPPRPAVNPSARVVRGKTVQLGVYKTARQAEIAWQSAIRDYTFLVTMPKSIQRVRIRSKLYYRLQLGTPSRTYARQLCGNLKQIGRSCTVA